MKICWSQVSYLSACICLRLCVCASLFSDRTMINTDKRMISMSSQRVPRTCLRQSSRLLSWTCFLASPSFWVFCCVYVACVPPAPPPLPPRQARVSPRATHACSKIRMQTDACTSFLFRAYMAIALQRCFTTITNSWGWWAIHAHAHIQRDRHRQTHTHTEREKERERRERRE